jgi:hypothetical protein
MDVRSIDFGFFLVSEYPVELYCIVVYRCVKHGVGVRACLVG